jgi:enoyl-CoA hydratase
MTTELFEDYEAITFSREGRILTMTLNRPDTLNAASASHPIGAGN